MLSAPAQAAVPPANDAFATPAELTGETPSVAGTTVDATTEPAEAMALPGVGGTVWYRWTAPSSGTVTMDVCDATFDSLLGVYTGTSLNSLVYQSDDDDTCQPGSAVAFTAQAGVTYRIVVAGYRGTTGTFTLKVNGPPYNDTFANSRDLTGREWVSGFTYRATRETGEPNHGGVTDGHSVWFTYSVTRNRSVTLKLCQSIGTMNTVAAVYTGAGVAALTPVTTTGDDCNPTFQAAAGTTYRIALDGKQGATGRYYVGLPPANDDFAGAKTYGEFESYGDTTAGTSEPGEPSHAGGSGHSLWFNWTPTTSTTYTLDTCGSEAPTAIAVYTGNAVNALTPVSSSRLGTGYCGSTPGSGTTVNATAGITYRIAVDAAGATLGGFGLAISTRPANDAFADGIALTGATVYGSTRAATKEAGEPKHANGAGVHSVWYRFTPAGTRNVSFDACGNFFGWDAVFTPAIAVYTGNAVNALSPLTSSAGGAASCYFGGGTVNFLADAGTEYRIAIDAPDDLAGPFTLAQPAAPANDNLADATPLGGNSGYTGGLANLVGATKEPTEPNHAGNAGGHSVWFAFTAPSSGRFSVDTCSYLDTVLAVYTGNTYATLQQVEANDDATACGAGAKGSQLTFDAVSGTTYRIAVDGKDGAVGSIYLSTNPAPGNDHFANAYTLSGSSGSTTKGATKQTGEPQHAGDPGGASVWWRFTASTSEDVTVTTCPVNGYTSFDTVLAVYTGTSVNALTLKASNDDDEATCGSGSKASSVTFPATAGTEYRIAVDGKGGAAGYTGIELKARPANDSFATADQLYGEASTAYVTTALATRETGEPAHAGNSTLGSVWYRWTPVTSGPAVLEACSTVDTLIAVYTGASVTALTPIASDDDGCAPGSRVFFPAVAGTTYRIAVLSRAPANFTLTLSATASNDAFASARQIGVLPPNSAYPGSTRFASRETGEPNHAGNAGGHSIWFTWTAPATGAATVHTCYSNFDTLLGVYTGSAVNALTEIASSDDQSGCGSGTQSRTEFPAVAGTVYFFAIDGKNGASGQAALSLTMAQTNDAFANPVTLASLPSTQSGTLAQATVEAGEPQHASVTAGASVWYRWTPANDIDITIETCGSTADTLLAVYTGEALGALTPIKADDDACAPGSSVSFRAEAGKTYRIAVAARTPSGSFTLNFRFPPSNDNFASAQDLYGDAVERGAYNGNATREAGEPVHANVSGGRSVWFSWTAPRSGTTTVSTCGSVTTTTFDTLLGVYTGTAVDALTEIKSNDDGPDCGSRLSFTAVAGTKYMIAVDGKNGTSGNFTLAVTPPPTNDDRANALNISGSGSYPGSTVNAGAEAGEPAHHGVAASRSVWYRWTPATSGEARIATCTASFDTRLAVYTTALESVASNDDGDRCGSTGSAVTFTAAAGTTYLIAVDGGEGTFWLQYGHPANDFFSDPATLTGRQATVSGDLRGAGGQSGEPAHAGQPAAYSLWYRWVAPANGPTTLSLCGVTSGRIAVYTGATLATLSPAGASTPATCPSVTFTAAAGTTYRFALDASAPSSFTFTLTAPPVNDDFTDAIDLHSDLTSATGRTTNAGREPGEPGDGHTVWYRWTAPRTGETTVETCGRASFAAFPSVYTGAAVTALTPVGTLDDCRVTFFAAAGTEYRIAVDGRAGATGTFSLEFELPPANDAFANAEALSESFASGGTTRHGSAEAGEPAHAGVAAVRSVWHSWTAPADVRVIADTCGSAIATRLAVYTGISVSALSLVGQDGSGLACTGSRVVFDAVGGTTYRFAVDGPAGSFVLRLTVAPANDDFASARVLGTSVNPVSGTTNGATVQSGEPDIGPSVWYRWTASVTGTVRVQACSARVAVYTGSALGALTPQVTGGCDVTFEATIGTEYRIQVGGSTAFTLAFALPPANDRFAAPATVSETAVTVTGTNVLAGTEVGEPSLGGHTVWWRWTAPVTGTVAISTCGSGFDTQLGVYSGSAIGALTTLGTNDNHCGVASKVSFPAVAGTVYRIAVGGATTGQIRLNVNVPANDDAADAIVLSGASVSTTGSNIASSVEPGETGSNTVWWRWTAPASGSATISTCGSDFDTTLAVLTGATLIASNDTNASCGQYAQVTFPAVAGTEYRIAVGGYSTGRVVLAINAPANDRFASATTVSSLIATTVSSSNAGATKELGEPDHAGVAGGSSVWFNWTAPSGAGSERVTACGIDSIVAVYTGSSVGALTALASAIDGCAGAVFTAAPGQTYRIAVDGRTTGAFTLKFERAAPDNDNFAAATVLDGAATVLTAGATAEAGEPAHAGVPAARSVWFRWTGIAGTTTIDTCGSDYDTRLAVYEGTSLAALTPVASDEDSCANGTSRVMFPAVAGRVYRIAVDGASTGSLVVHVNRPPNDDRAAAIDVTAGTFTGTTVGATADMPTTSTLGNVWYRWTAPRSGAVTMASTCPNPTSQLEVYDVGSLSRQLFAGCSLGSQRGTFVASAGTVYLIAVGSATPGGEFTLRVDVPANDAQADAVTLTGSSASVSADTAAASADTGGTNSIWYAWTASANGTVDIDACGSAATVRVFLDGTQIATGTCPSVRFTAAIDKRYEIAVGGVAGPVSLHLEASLDTTPPQTTIDSGPAAFVNSSTVAFTYGSNEAGSTFECSLDDAAFVPCAASFSALAEGPHTLKVRAIDTSRNVDATPAERSFTVDLTAPETTLGAVSVDGAAISVAFTSEPEAVFECSLDGAPYAACVSPFTRSGLSDGDHEFAVRARDRAGNLDPTPATRTLAVDNNPPETTISSGPSGDLAGRSASFAFVSSEGGSTFKCSLDDAAFAACVSPVALSGLSDGAHRFRVRATDAAGHEDLSPAERLFVVDGAPLTALAGDDLVATIDVPVAFDGRASRPRAGVESYVWDFGDGAAGSGAQASHSYNTAGEYTARLTVGGMGTTAVDSVRVRVVQPAVDVKVTVRSEGGGVLAGADVLVLQAGGARVQAVTGGDGVAHLSGLAAGTYTAYAQAPGHVPGTTKLTVGNAGGSAEAVLKAGPVAAGVVNVHRMTRDEIIAAGIDVDAPENNIVYSFTVTLPINGSTRSFSGFTGGGGWVSTPGCSVNCPRGHSRMTAGGPVITWVLPGEARFLKEFFRVDLVVQNLAPAEFKFTGAQAAINVPPGMSLAPVRGGQSRSQAVADIPGGSSSLTTWTLRGDAEGFYDVSIDYHAVLQPFGTDVELRAETGDPIHVWGASAVKLKIDADARASRGYPFHLRVGMENVSDVAVYNAALKLGDPPNVIFQPRQEKEQATEEIAPGETFWADYTLVPDDSGKVILSSATVQFAGETKTSTAVTEHEPADTPDTAPRLTTTAYKFKTVLEWDPIPGATQYEIYKTTDLRTPFGDVAVPMLSVGGSTTAAWVPATPGDHPWYAISAVVDGKRVMHHPVKTGDAVSLAPWPKSTISYVRNCVNETVSVRVTVLGGPHFGLKETTIRYGTLGTPQTIQLSGSKFEHEVSLANRAGSMKITVDSFDEADNEPTRTETISPCRYVALGDSFSSGEGNPPYVEGTHTDDIDGGGFQDNTCHRSKNSAYGQLLSKDDGAHDVIPHNLYSFRACSGAIFDDFFSLNHKWLEDGNNFNEPAQIEHLDTDVALATLTMGGNDLFLAPVLSDCVQFGLKIPSTSCKGNWEKGDANDVHKALDRLKARLPGDYKRLRAKMGPDAKLLVLTYPEMFPDSVFEDGFGFNLATKAAAAGCKAIWPWDVGWLHENQEKLNDAIREGVRKTGDPSIQVVDLNDRFEGKDVCQANGFDRWFNGIIVPNKEHSFHPNEGGQADMKAAVLAHLRKGPGLFSRFVMKVGDVVEQFVNVLNGAKSFTAGARWPGSDVDVELVSPSGKRVTVANAGANGAVFDEGPTHSSVTVSDPEPGAWKVELIGRELAAAGENVDYVSSVETPAPAGPPSARFTASTRSLEAGRALSFDAGGSVAEDGSALTYAWNFGDGTTGAGKTVSHTYAAAGEYTPALLVTDGAGRKAAYSAGTITVTAPAPVDPGTGDDPGTGGDPGGGGLVTPQPTVQPTPTPAPIAGPLLGGITVPSKVRLKSFKKGLKVVVEVKTPNALVGVKVATRVGKKTIALGAVAPKTQTVGKKTFMLKPSASALKKLKAKRVKLTVEITARGSTGTPTVVRKTVTLQR